MKAARLLDVEQSWLLVVSRQYIVTRLSLETLNYLPCPMCCPFRIAEVEAAYCYPPRLEERLAFSPSQCESTREVHTF